MGQAPTGFGKTVIATHIAHSALERGSRVWFICHRRELLDQTEDAFMAAGLSCDFIMSGRKYRNADISLCSVSTLANRYINLNYPDICIWDEAHHITANTYAKIQRDLSASYHIGLTATPERLDGKGLDEYFDSLVLGPSTEWLIGNGYLSPFEVYSTPIVPDMSGVKKSMGDFAKGETAERSTRPDIVGDAVKHYQTLCSGKQGIAFCVNIYHAETVCAAFVEAGIRAAVVSSKTDSLKRSQIMLAFRRKEIDVLFNCDLFGEGVDVPAIECVILLRPTESLALFLQQVGRVLRFLPNKLAIILDHAGNVMRHGFPDDERVWSLEGKKARGDEEKVITIKQCAECFHIHRPAPACPKCGYVYETKVRELEVDEGTDLVKLDKQQMQRNKRKEVGMAKSNEALIEIGRARGYKSPERWAQYVLSGREKKASERS